jgi:hypothetical protein
MFFVAWFWEFFEMAIYHTLRANPEHSDLANPALESLLQWSQWPVTQINGSRREAVRPVPPAADQHADPAAVGHDRYLGAPRAAVGDRKGAIIGLLLTILLGMASPRFRRRVQEAGFSYDGSIYGSAFFMATGFHGFHVVIGTGMLMVCLIRLYGGWHEAGEAPRLRIRRLVLALRRRGVAVPLRVRLRDAAYRVGFGRAGRWPLRGPELMAARDLAEPGMRDCPLPRSCRWLQSSSG